MKNVLFSLAFILIGSFAFANNSNEKVSYDTYSIEKKLLTNDLVGTCYITIGFYDEDGVRVGGVVLAITDVSSAEECNDISNQISEALSKM